MHREEAAQSSPKEELLKVGYLSSLYAYSTTQTDCRDGAHQHVNGYACVSNCTRDPFFRHLVS